MDSKDNEIVEIHLMEKQNNPQENNDEPEPEKNDTKEEDDIIKPELLYGISDRPPWISTLLMSFQYLTKTISSNLILPLIVSRSLCYDKDPALTTQLIATSLVICGTATILQSWLGSRLPIIQGPSAAFVIPVIAMLSLKGECPPLITANSTEEEIMFLREEAYGRMNMVQGSLLISSLIQCIIGFTGLVGLLLRYIGPITIGVTLSLIGISIFDIAILNCEKHWGISIASISLVILFSQFLTHLSIPLPGGRGFRLFTLFPMLLAIVIMWIVCAIMTSAGAFPDEVGAPGYQARTDIKFDNLKKSPWILIPYPGQWGAPTFNIAGIAGMMIATIASIVESIGDYHACAFIGGAPPPPVHAINRGIGMEGFGSVMAALFGTGFGYTSYSNNVAIMSLTKVSSRIVFIIAGVGLIITGFFCKLGALFNTIPAPILGSTLAVTIGMVTAIGISNFRHVKMTNSRNLFIVGFAFFLGISVPRYMKDNRDLINTGSDTVDQLIQALMSNGMFLGGLSSFVFDLLLKGTPEERGLNWRTKDISQSKGNLQDDEETKKKLSEVYDIPFGMTWIRSHGWTRRLPFSPTFTGMSRRE